MRNLYGPGSESNPFGFLNSPMILRIIRIKPFHMYSGRQDRHDFPFSSLAITINVFKITRFPKELSLKTVKRVFFMGKN